MTLEKFVYNKTDVQEWVATASAELDNPRNSKWLYPKDKDGRNLSQQEYNDIHRKFLMR